MSDSAAALNLIWQVDDEDLDALLDSISQVEARLLLAEEFGIFLSEDASYGIRTPRDVKAMVERAIDGRSE